MVPHTSLSTPSPAQQGHSPGTPSRPCLEWCMLPQSDFNCACPAQQGLPLGTPHGPCIECCMPKSPSLKLFPSKAGPKVPAACAKASLQAQLTDLALTAARAIAQLSQEHFIGRPQRKAASLQVRLTALGCIVGARALVACRVLPSPCLNELVPTRFALSPLPD